MEFFERPLHGTKHIELRCRVEFPAVGASFPRSSKEQLIVGVSLVLHLFEQVQNHMAYSSCPVLEDGWSGLGWCSTQIIDVHQKKSPRLLVCHHDCYWLVK